MKWKPLMAVLLGLLMVGVTAGSAIAMPIQKEPIKPRHNIGLGSVLMSWLVSYDNAIISKNREYHGRLGYVWHYKVRHGKRGRLSISVFKYVPLFGYSTYTILPDMTIYKDTFGGKNFKLKSIKSHRVPGTGIRFKTIETSYSSWLSAGGWWEIGLKFDAGYGRHGIVTFGMSNLDNFIIAFLGKLGAGKWADKIIDFVSKGSLSSLADALSAIMLFASGINIDAVYFTEV
ncbi:hypothetical protein [Thermococcus sp. 21S7]|uniref:hypothetical protein n=1 Tax=Thermococcus sp. 21S7 TaxID=1638221 RepID=UPI00143ADED0|nr:hypothetical protein [Thermococcus sp. 21S7]NJE61853.1 hypothetical protein [Thermococcus sp. 21S7]